MSLAFGQDWAASVGAVCDPVMGAAQVGFQRQIMRDPDSEPVTALLWEADPGRFAARYPDSGITESYGSEWPGVHCIDYWVYVDAVAEEARISVEGWSHRDQVVPLTGDGRADGEAIGDVMARILRVLGPS